MSSAQLVGGGGAALIILNAWTGPARKAIANGAFNPSATDAQRAAAKTALRGVGLAGLFVLAATLIATVSDQWATAMAVMLLALFVLWAINHYGKAGQ